MSTVIHPATEIYYPDSDGQPMAESDFQREPLIYAVESLRIHFRQREDVYVSGNMFIYYEEGNPKAVVAPDVFAVIGAPNRDRYSYKLWQEPKGPDFVLEITSKSTRTEDRGAKRGIYALLGVSEYWQYDPTGDYLQPPLQAYRLVDENYWPLPADTLMLRARGGEFDAVVAMYHDQGHIALKLLGMHRAVNITLGLPIIRTSVDHGTAFDIAGQNKADATNMKSALKMAVTMAGSRNRK